MPSFFSCFTSAIGFLTLLPVPGNHAFHSKEMRSFFPLTGLLIGAIIAPVDMAAAFFFGPFLVATLSILLLIVLTGALHLDGIGDTADGLYGIREKEKRLTIMKDSRVGAMGVIAIVLVVLLKVSALGAIEANRFLIWLLVPAYARASVLFAIKSLPYARSEKGTGQTFFQAPLKLTDFWGVLLIFLLSFFLGFSAIIFNTAFILTNIIILFYYHKKMGGITGDMLGAMIEVNEAMLLLTLSAKV